MGKNILFVATGLLFLLSACNNQNNKQKSEEVKIQDSTIHNYPEREKVPIPENFYKRYEGEINGEKVIINLQRYGKTYGGNYIGTRNYFSLIADRIMGPDSFSLSLASPNYKEKDVNDKPAKLLLAFASNGLEGHFVDIKNNINKPVSLTENYDDGAYQLSYHIYSDSIKANPKIKKSAVGEIDFRYLKANANQTNESWINDRFKETLSLKFKHNDWEAAIKKSAKEYLSDYQSQIKELGDFTSASANYSSSTSQSIEYNGNGYIIISTTNYDYSGGAHGNYGTLLSCLDVNNKKKLSLKDIIKIDSNSLQAILERNFRQQAGLNNSIDLNTVLFDSYVKPNKNFYFNHIGLAFLYNPYEIASYAQGQITITIPYSDLKNYLNQDFKKRLLIK